MALGVHSGDPEDCSVEHLPAHDVVKAPGSDCVGFGGSLLIVGSDEGYHCQEWGLHLELLPPIWSAAV